MKPNLHLSLCSIIFTSLSILQQIPRCFSQDYQQYKTCGYPFQCGGTIGEIRYPFWGDERPSSCGYPGFKLSCQEDVPRLSTTSLSYQILEIDNSSRTLRVSRDDLRSSNLCPRLLHDTTLNFTLFDFYSSAGDQNITLYYGCTLNQPLPPNLLPRQFYCVVNNTNSSSFFHYPTPEAPSIGNGITCKSHISVPVNRTAAQEILATPSIAHVVSAVKSGFWIQWSADNVNCHNCMQSGGLCGQNPDSGSFACHCTDRSYTLTCNDTRTGNGNGSRKGHSDQQKHVIIGMTLGVAGILLSSLIIFYITKQCRLHELDRRSNQKVDEFLLNNGSPAPKRYSYNEIKKITKSFTDKLGQGGYGTVYKGKLPDGQLAAVKVLTETNENGEEFINEVASISRTSHVNIVNLLGFCYDKKRRALVYEFMPNKSLDKFIYRSGQLTLEWKKLHKIAVGIARGLEYLHRGCNPRIVHFDIKPHNILLDEDFCPKISDFGLAKLSGKKQSIISLLGTRGTIGYIAPEVFSRSFGAVSHRSDVYSYGMVLLEMTGARKFDDIEAIHSSENYFPDKIYKHAVLNDNKLDYHMTEEDEGTARKMLLTGLWCIQTAPSDRPSMTKVVEMLEGSLQSIQIPPNPFFSPPNLSAPQFSSCTISIDVETQNFAED